MNTRLFAFVFALLSSLCFFVARPIFSQDEDDSEAEARKAAERFLLVLERNPRRGTALDKVVEFHVDHESLDELITRLREKAEATEYEDAGRAWLVVGLIEASQGDAESAQPALERADELLPKSAVASFTLGQNLMTLNRWEDAAAALERAIQRQPAPTDLLDVFQTLGRVQQRLAPGDKVVDVWNRLEKLVPNDPRVPELIAKTLLDDGHWEAALPRFEALARATKDLYQRSEFELEAVDLRLKLGQFEQALADADRLLGGLKPDHWLFRETRRRVEEAFLVKDDAAGLIKHYEERLAKQPDDLDAIVRLSRTFVSQDRHKDARARLEAGIKLAPSSVELRLELIELLQSEQQFSEAIAQYEQLDRIEPNNPDHIRDWGFLILKGQGSEVRSQEDTEQAARAKSAAAIWRKLVVAKPMDAVVAAQVAGMMASAEKSLLDDAAVLLRRAIELEPETLSHREQLGEVLDSDGKKDESLAAWRSMAEEPRRNANNLAQLADVLSRFGYRDESLTTIDAACELDRKSLELRFQQAELRRKWKQAESAMAALAEAAALADTPETFDRVVQLEVKVLSESELLSERIEALQAELARDRETGRQGGKENDRGPSKAAISSSPGLIVSPSFQHFRLAKYLEAADKLREATVAARKAVELEPRNGVFLQSAAKMLTQDSQWLSAVELYERLLKIDRRFRIDSLRAIAELEQKLGRKDKALKAGRELLAAAPGNPESAEFVVEVYLRFNQNAEALQILRRASRQNVADKRLALKLVERLIEDGPTLFKANGGRQPPGPASEKTNVSGASNTPGGLRPPFASTTDEAREILWRVFEQTAKSDDRIEIVRKLAELSVFPGEFAKLTQRLERYRTDPKLRRDASLALVQVHEQAGDTQQARRELERWLPQAPRDPALLARMVSLCEAAGDLEAAIAHQRRLAEVTHKREADEHLIVLLRRAGRDAEADALATRWLESERDPAKVLKEIDRLFSIGKRVEALELTSRWVGLEPNHWEFRYREAVGLLANDQPEVADKRFQEILALALPDDTASLIWPTQSSVLNDRNAALSVRVQRLQSRLQMRWSAMTGYQPASPQSPNPSSVNQSPVRPTNVPNVGGFQYVALSPEKSRPTWLPVMVCNPSDFGMARLLILMRMVYVTKQSPPWIENAQQRDSASARQVWDDFYFAWVSDQDKALTDAVNKLVDLGDTDPLARWAAIRAVWRLRGPQYDSYGTGAANTQDLEGKDPLPAVVLDRLFAAFLQLMPCEAAMDWSNSPLIETIAGELVRARQPDKLRELLAEFERTTTSPDGFGWLIQRACRRGDVDAALEFLPKYAASFAAKARTSTNTSTVIPPSDPNLVAWWLQNLVWQQIGADLSDPSAPRQELTVKAKGNVHRIVAAAVTVFSDSRLPKPSLSFAPTMTAGWQRDKRASVSNALLPSANPVGTLGLGQEMSLFWVARNHLGRTILPFPHSIQSPERCALAVLLQASVIGGHSDTRKAELVVGSAAWQSELREHVAGLSKQFEAGSKETQLADLCHTSLLVWQGNSAEALSSMKQLFENATHHPTLQLEIVSYFLKDNQQDLALDLLDRIETNDGQLRKEIEQRAVQLAGKLGRVDRVRLAAERLFGMKLDPAEEQQLAATLSGLGLHEQAEAIRQRLPQRAGNNLAVLQQAMQERIDAKKIEEACQIAEQIIRRTSPANTLIGSVQQSTFGGGQQARVITTTSQARTKALALLGQQGRLGPLIEQAEQQFDRSPQSLKLFGQLAELYGAEGANVGWDSVPTKRVGTESQPTNDKIAKLLVRLADSDAPDPQFRLTLARALVSAGKAELAVPHFLFAIERLPNATAQVLFEAEQILSELGHVDDLAAIVLKSKLAVNDQQRVELFRRIVQRLEGPPIRAKLIIQLFEKALREAPEFRPMLASQLLALSGSVWQQEELWPLARDLVVPPADRKIAGVKYGPAGLYGVDVMRLREGQQIDSIVGRTVELAAQLKKLDELTESVKAAMQQHPDWDLGGNIVLGFVRLRQGRLEDAKRHFGLLLVPLGPTPSDSRLTLMWIARGSLIPCAIGAELARAHDFDAAVQFYSALTANEFNAGEREPTSLVSVVLEHCRVFGKEPAMQQLAVRIVNRMLAKLDDPDELARQAGSPLFVEAAKITAEINQPYTSARLAQAMITRWQLPGANNSDGGTWLEQLEQRFANSLAAIKPAMLPAIVEQSVVRTPTSEQAAEQKSNRPDVGVRSTPGIDLLPHVAGDSLTTLRLDSPFVSLIREAAKDKELWAKWTESLRRMGTPARPADAATNGKPNNAGMGKSAHPTDLSLAILAALTELNAQTSELSKTSEVSALSRLVEVAKANLKAERPRAAPPGFHPQLGLWLVARECLAREEHKKLGEELAELATESAALHFDPRFQWAILRERGELALKAGDKELAKKFWTRLAEDVLRPRSAEEAVPMLLGQQFVWSANWPSTRLSRARDLCRLTLNAEMPELSLAIFRDTINWPKTTPFQAKAQFNSAPRDDTVRGEIVLDANVMASSGLAEEILAMWDTLEPEWRAKGVAADAIFATLLECVLPTSQPEDVFVFAVRESVVRTPTSERFANSKANRPDVGVRSTSLQPQSLALRLVELAVAEKRIDTLAQRLAEREKSVTNPLALRLIHLLLVRRTNDEQRLDAELAQIARHDWSKPTIQDARVATQIVGLLAPLTERREPVGKLFEHWLTPLGKAFPRDEHPLADVRRWLAKQELADSQIDKAKETVSAHLRHMDQVWSATGAMDGQHLRRLELLAIATDYANAGLTREAIDLLAQVADARWPDRYPDENPGPVLAILETKLQSRPAQERYELWRTWSLPNDGVKSMRMLTGAEVRGQKSEVRELKSTAYLLVEAAREADRLAELDAFVEEQMKQRPSDRIHVLLALVHFANKAPAVAEQLVRQQLTLWEPQAGKSNSATRTRVWDDWLLSVACSRHESLRELADQLVKRAESGARELKDEVLLSLLRR